MTFFLWHTLDNIQRLLRNLCPLYALFHMAKLKPLKLGTNPFFFRKGFINFVYETASQKCHTYTHWDHLIPLQPIEPDSVARNQLFKQTFPRIQSHADFLRYGSSFESTRFVLRNLLSISVRRNQIAPGNHPEKVIKPIFLETIFPYHPVIDKNNSIWKPTPKTIFVHIFDCFNWLRITQISGPITGISNPSSSVSSKQPKAPSDFNQSQHCLLSRKRTMKTPLDLLFQPWKRWRFFLRTVSILDQTPSVEHRLCETFQVSGKRVRKQI